jgi:hypothetical protein
MLNPEITKGVKFIHLRRRGKGVGGLSHDGLPLARGGVTIGFKESSDKEVMTVLYTFAKCHDNDNFNKKIGREKCCYRLTGKNVKFLRLPIGIPREDIRSILIEAYYEEQKIFNRNINLEIY